MKRFRQAPQRQGDVLLLLSETSFAGFSNRFSPKRPILHDLSPFLAELPEGQRRVAQELVGSGYAKTYAEVAARLNLSLGTVYRHLKRIRERRPAVYAALMETRWQQLRQRHSEAVERRSKRSAAWHRRQANRRYRERFGYYPWERYG